MKSISQTPIRAPTNFLHSGQKQVSINTIVRYWLCQLDQTRMISFCCNLVQHTKTDIMTEVLLCATFQSLMDIGRDWSPKKKQQLGDFLVVVQYSFETIRQMTKNSIDCIITTVMSLINDEAMDKVKIFNSLIF